MRAKTTGKEQTAADRTRDQQRNGKGFGCMTKPADSQFHKNEKLSAAGGKTTPVSVCSDILSGVVGVYVFVMLTVFPLYASDMYFNILVDRYYFFWIGTAIMMVISAAVALISLFVDLRENNGANFREVRKNMRGDLRAADYFLLFFLLIALISTLCSDWLYEAFWGNMGRYQGFFIWIWYASAYFMVTRFFRFRQAYLDAALAVGLYVAFWGIQDYLGLDPHGWLLDVDDTQRAMFTSSIGNINTYTAVIGIYTAISAVLFTGTDGSAASAGTGIKKYIPAVRSGFYAVCVILFFAALITGQSDNAVLSVGAVLCFLPFYAWKNRRGFVRYWLAAAGFFLALLLTRYLTLKYEPEFTGFWSGELLAISEKTWSGKAAAFCALIAAAAWLVLKSIGKKDGPADERASALSQPLPSCFRFVWAGLLAVVAGILIWMFWDANHGGHPEWYAPYSNIFYFNNDWGTHRGHNWSILMRHFQEFPLWKKLIGDGPETYGIVTRVNDYTEMIEMYGEVYDSPHNEFLQYLFSTGILGFIGYYGFILANCCRELGIAWKKKCAQNGDVCAAACAFAAITYAASSFINISVPIVVPLMLIFLFIGNRVKEKQG